VIRHVRLIGSFVQASVQEEAAYRANYWVGLAHSLLNLVTGVLGIAVLFGQVETVRGWDFAATLALLGVYLTAGALRGLFIGPSLDALAGMDGEVWSGRLDFTLLRPVDIQFLASFRRWRALALFDLLLGAGVLAVATAQMHAAPGPARVAVFLAALAAGMLTLYALLLAGAALVFWSPGTLFTWIFDGLFQLARYPLGLYPGWLRLMLTWIVPVGVITTVPAEALAGTLSPDALAGSAGLAAVLFVAASALFRRAVRRYEGASS